LETQLYKPSVSAVDRRVIFAFVLFEVEVTDGSTIGDVSFYIILHADTITSGEGSHLSLTTLVPDNTLDETLASANRIEVDLCGGGVESHVVRCFDPLNIHAFGCLCHSSGHYSYWHMKLELMIILFLWCDGDDPVW